MTAENANVIAELESLRRCDRDALDRIYRTSHRVCSTSELTKTDLVWGILHARHGEARIQAALAASKAAKAAARRAAKLAAVAS